MAKGTVATKYPIDLTGLRFGKLIVIGKGENYCSPKGSTASQWYCQCDCGSEPVLLRRDSLITGNTRSCGCLHEEVFVTHHGGAELDYIKHIEICYAVVMIKIVRHINFMVLKA